MRSKIELYIMSLGLLFLLLIIKTINIPIYLDPNWEFIGWRYLLGHNIPTIVCLSGVIAAVICRKRFLKSLEGCQDLPCTIEKIENINYEYLTFLATYIIPLTCFDLDNIQEWLLLICLLIIIGVLFIKTNLYYQNPSLALMGFNIYVADITYKKGTISNTIIISKSKLQKGSLFYKHDIENTEVIYGVKESSNKL